LEMVTDAERDYLWSTYATDPRARINLGIRRRLATLMDNDRRKIELMNALLMSLPGTPIIYYGDEIGMGDNIYLGDRNGVRTPMQWTPDRNGGFSRCDPARLYLPTIMDPVYGYEAVNVEAQSRSLGSLLSSTKRLIAVRKSSKVFGRGSLTFLRPSNRSVLVYLRQIDDEILLCVSNLSRSAQAAEIDLSRWRGRQPLEMLGRSSFPPIGDHPYLITLAPYGFFWLRLCEPVAPIEAPGIAPEFYTLVVANDWSSLLRGRSRSILEREVLPAFLSGRRWFAERGSLSFSTTVVAFIPLATGDPDIALALIQVVGERETALYSMPLAIQWTRLDREKPTPNALSAVRRGPREGTLLEAAANAQVISLILDKVHAGETLDAAPGTLEFRPIGGFGGENLAPIHTVKAVDTEQSNTTALVDTHYVVKLFRRIERGINPEVEVGRFLTETAPFANTPPLLGTVTLVDGEVLNTVAVVHRFVENQGDVWSMTSAYLDRYVEEQRLLTTEAAEDSDEQTAYALRMRPVGRRVAEMQVALASRDDIPEFAPEPVAPQDVRTWTDELLRRASAVFDEIVRRQREFPERDAELIDALLAHRDTLRARVSGLLPETIEAAKIRHHGDLHLGQMLVVKDDVFIIDFEGEPRRPLEHRRRKAPAARDVAGLIRSIDYSAGAALGRALNSAPDTDGRIARALDHWRDRSVAAALAAYREFMADPRLWPRERDAADGMLDFFLIEKAFYEVEYELSHRPDWLRIPLAGLLRILSAPAEVPV
jgi:maltose alpha-D-glucosyltransferase/alpha-amylase